MSAIAVSNQSFVQIPLEILNAPLGDKAKLLWVELKRLSNKNTHTVYAYMEHMARYLGCTVRHVRNIIRQLIDAKIIEDTGKVNGFGNRIFRFVCQLVIPVKTGIPRSGNLLDLRFREDDKDCCASFTMKTNANNHNDANRHWHDNGKLMQQAWQKIYDTCRFDNRSMEELKHSKLFQDLVQAEFLNLQKQSNVLHRQI